MHVFLPHSTKQQEAIVTDKQINLVVAGTQWGKTRVGALRIKSKIHTFTDKEDNFLITSPTYKTLHQSTLPAFLKYMDGYGRYDNKFDVFRVNNGGIVYCRTEHDPDSIIGITNIRHIWGDEAGKYRKYFWENIQARADFCGCDIDLTTSPYAMNWLPKELIKPYLDGKRPDINYIQAASWENPYHSLHDPIKRQAKKETMDARRFSMIYGGEHGQMVGLVYDCFNEAIHVCKPFKLPNGTKFYGGIDWGYTEPYALSVRAITPSGHHFRVSEFYKTGLTIKEMAEAALQKKKIFGIERFYAGPDRPENIEYFNREGIPTMPAINSKRIGLDTHYDLIKSGKYKIFEGSSPHALDEYSTYHYPEDEEEIGPNEKAKEKLPVEQGDHVMDSERYITIMTVRNVNKKAPTSPQDKTAEILRDHEKRIEYRKKMSKRFPGSENFS